MVKESFHTSTYSSEGLNDHPLVVIRACGCFQDIKKNLFEKHLRREKHKYSQVFTL